MITPALLLAALAQAGEIVGTVVHIQDGDTLTVLDSGKRQYKIRLLDIDAPERRQPFYAQSTKSLGEMCFQKLAKVDWSEQDRYDRYLGRVVCDGVDANAEQVRRGMAWVFVRYAPKDSPLYAVEANAKVNRDGLWHDRKPIPPWEWRAFSR